MGIGLTAMQRLRHSWAHPKTSSRTSKVALVAELDGDEIGYVVGKVAENKER
jgi:hypothetical protein